MTFQDGLHVAMVFAVILALASVLLYAAALKKKDRTWCRLSAMIMWGAAAMSLVTAICYFTMGDRYYALGWATALVALSGGSLVLHHAARSL